MSLLHFHNIVKQYRNKKVLDGVTLNIEKKERVALIGNNGSGKSTLLKIAMNQESPDLGQVVKARGIKIGYLSQNSDEALHGHHHALHYEKIYQLEKSLRDLENQLEAMAQDHESAVYHAVMQEYAKKLQDYECMDGYTITSKIKKILLGIGLKKDALLIPMNKLSGGEKIRVALARILLEEPDLLILDEPTNHLDIKAVEWLEDYLKKFSGGTLIVSHDRYFLDKVATRIAELENGTLIEKRCNYTSFIQQKERLRDFYHKEQKNLKIKIREKEAVVRQLKEKNKIKQANSRKHEIEKLKEQMKNNQIDLRSKEHLSRKDGPSLVFNSHGHISKRVAWAENLSKSFNGHVLFSDVTFEIGGGERVAIIGSNGCGKTTLLNILLKRDTDYQGTAKLGQWIKYCYLGQNVSFEVMNRTLLEETMISHDLDEKASREHLAQFQFYGDAVNTKIESLSGGEKVRLFLAKMMLEHPHCLILDEPTNHLDLTSKEAVEKAIRDFRGTVISVSHDRYYLTHSVNKIIEIEQKKSTTYQGNYIYYKQQKSKEQENAKQKKAPIDSKVKKKIQAKPEKEMMAVKEQEKDLASIEMEICVLEDQIKEIEKELNTDTSIDHYYELERLNRELEALYELYE